ncbi:hypothetical protein [Rufibacter radiotolerans]|nr:hypothetical protein [Rufibacter radiotolerans]
MKKLNLFLFCIIALLSFSCGEDEPRPDTEMATKKNLAWKSEKAPSVLLWHNDVTNVDSLALKFYNQNGQFNGELNVQVNFKGVGIYRFSKDGTAFYYEYINGTLLNDYHLSGTEFFSELRIQEWNPATRFIKGSFQFTLNKSTNSSPPSPEILELTGGAFEGTVTGP